MKGGESLLLERLILAHTLHISSHSGSFSDHSLQWTLASTTVSKFKKLARVVDSLPLLNSQCRKLDTLEGLHAPSF